MWIAMKHLQALRQSIFAAMEFRFGSFKKKPR